MFTPLSVERKGTVIGSQTSAAATAPEPTKVKPENKGPSPMNGGPLTGGALGKTEGWGAPGKSPEVAQVGTKGPRAMLPQPLKPVGGMEAFKAPGMTTTSAVRDVGTVFGRLEQMFANAVRSRGRTQPQGQAALKKILNDPVTRSVPPSPSVKSTAADWDFEP